MKPGKTHLIASLQPLRLEVVAAQINASVFAHREGFKQSPVLVMPNTAALTELSALLDAYEAALQRHAAAVVWEEEYVEEEL